MCRVRCAKPINIPRQARDKHRESTQKQTGVYAGSGRRQHHPTREWIDKVQNGDDTLLKMIVDDSEVFLIQFNFN
jgi:hypothetical protein